MFATAFFCLVELLLISVTLLILYWHSAGCQRTRALLFLKYKFYNKQLMKGCS